ncbi:MAG TPA: EamA family transporter [Steroidobacteraceae bacterium]|nr:EamA family transporter [Steroidobacteraceae bacterium]
MSEDWRLFAFGSALFAALTAILAKVGVGDVDSDLATAFRTAVVLLLAVLIVLLRHKWPSVERWSLRSILFLTLSGLATGCSWLCYFRALKLGPASRVAPIDKLSVVFVVLLAALVLGERITLKSAFASALIALGAILLAF